MSQSAFICEWEVYGHPMLGGPFFSFPILIMSPHVLLTSSVSDSRALPCVFLSCCFQNILLVLGFQQFDCHVSQCGFPCIYLSRDSLIFPSMESHVFHQIWDVNGYYSLQHSLHPFSLPRCPVCAHVVRLAPPTSPLGPAYFPSLFLLLLRMGDSTWNYLVIEMT